ncbi:hypothetical protein C8A05DRAFT_11950 [Staphylotrichum tortipilum]|uniref:Zn(2)-C6 fungal-type domain-containing protein n=1 Tax=Staphylotrichum tortipilum TaxID=2831512 RepID=A0AAN6MUN8_9PEZI|nr:hypothetical protein C8A05DRAFT_11950 [Staphylotrichum longicolle]
MNDYYHHLLSSMMGVGGQPPNPNQLDGSGQLHQPPQQQQQQQHQQQMPMGGSPLPNPYQTLGYFGFPDPIMFNASKTQRSRRKSAPGLDHIKHRRTRSGCYTCRSRRVKCDETHPICERCRKGKRECIYPEPPPPKGSGGSSAKDSAGASQQGSPASSHGGDDDDDDGDGEQDNRLDPIMDEDEDEPESATSQTSAPSFPLRRSSTTSSFGHAPRGGPLANRRQGSETPSYDGNKSSSPALSAGAAGSAQTPQFPDVSTVTGSASRPDWTFLPHEMQFYLNYLHDNMTHYHYCLVSDADDFFRTVLPGVAVRHEALLYAVVGFAAYHHAMTDPNGGRIHEFLQYYSRSVTQLLDCLKKKEKYSVGTLLAILQLATIEEYLGDWVNLMGHQKAAFEILTQLFTPQTAMQTPIGRVAVAWYSRFDVFIGIMGSFRPSLGREWFAAPAKYYEARAAAEPHRTAWKVEACAARLRLASMDMAVLYAMGAKREVGEEQYAAEHRRLAAAWDEWKAGWDPALTDPAFLVTEFAGGAAAARGAGADSDSMIVDPFAPGALFRPPLFASTVMTCEYHSIAIMHGSQSAGRLTDEERARLTAHAYAILQICESVELWPQSPASSLVILQSCLAIAALFVPRDARHHMWIRRKFALLETMGYISPITMRTRMAELFDDDSCLRWWLPNDEGFSPLLQSVRAIADERNAMAASTQHESLQQIRHVFSRMQLGHDAHDDDHGKGKGPMA